MVSTYTVIRFMLQLLIRDYYYLLLIKQVSSPENPNNPAVFMHGESPIWDPDLQSLFYVDVHKQNVHRLDYTSGKILTKHIGN